MTPVMHSKLPDVGTTIFTVMSGLAAKLNDVIIFQPGYDSYIPNVEINGGIPVLVDLKFPEYKIDWNEVRQKISPRTKMIMLNSPHNPTGSVLRKEDIDQLRSIVKDTNIF